MGYVFKAARHDMLAKFGCDRYFISGQVYFSGVEHLYQCRKAWRHMQVYDNTFVGAERHHQIIIVAHFLLSIYKIGGRTVKSTYTYKVFNMGHRMEIYLSPEHASEVIALSESMGIPARIVGRVEDSDSNRLTIISEKGTFEY